MMSVQAEGKEGTDTQNGHKQTGSIRSTPQKKGRREKKWSDSKRENSEARVQVTKGRHSQLFKKTPPKEYGGSLVVIHNKEAKPFRAREKKDQKSPEGATMAD